MATKTIHESAVSINVNPNAPTGPVLRIVNGRPVVSSTEVAKHFGRQHNNVIRSIEAIVRNAPESFNALNFERVDYVDPKGEKRPAYDMTRDGFVIVAMGFTGKKAIEWKITYIMAFNAMEAQGMVATTGTLTAAQQQEIKELVQAKASAFPDAVKPKVFSQVWMRLQRKFKVPRYAELPVSLFGEARDYVIAMQIRSVDAPALTETETTALPPARTRNTLDDYKALFKELPDSPSLWLDLMNRTYEAAERFGREIEAIRDEATKPFRVGRKSMVQTYFDASMSPIYSLFNAARDDVRSTYTLTYDALEGCRDTWLLLHKG